MQLQHRLVFKLLSLMATDAGVTNITSTRVQYIFRDAVHSSCCLSDADLIFKGRIFFVGQWCHGLVGECTPGFFFASGTIPIRFDKIEPVAVIVRFW